MASKNEIIMFAAEKFTRFGSKRFTLDELAALLGISKKTIYIYFSSKEDLLTASIQYLIEEYNQSLKQRLSAETDPIESIIIMYKKAFEYLKYFKPSFVFGLRKYYPDAAKVFDDFREDFVKIKVYNFLKIAQDNGSLVDNVNLDLFCDLYFKRLEEIAFRHNNLFDKYSAKDLFNHFIVYSLRGIVKPTYLNRYF